ncbi:non-hydrolyzing UDP-N-acetylglucosamine 2-epimerase [Terribacillus sp. AE2B 122]|jgi:UDP-N-acetylglucosamine 2-epimerase (non-hydrolysing)|uniref:non-hydrolyzing UDP-N-acetylglucosamine 2-epimerase n=1 Tax=Terribacillus sp. AE2B 122 TaxID=1331902 RepID=UPI0015821445|nr:UDP-N-acetylglucosamine 2-epimerase (non-hydrolyzing) [Terribacillus sp. AE2B 122]
MKIAFVLGTRPEGIKLAPILNKLKDNPDFATLVINTGQHADLLDDVLQTFAIEPDYNLKLMKPNQSAELVVHEAIPVISAILRKEKPDLVFVVGDTATTFTGAFIAFHERIPVVHVEAGLRTDNPYSPFPEEMYRQLVTRLATFHLAPTEQNKENLIKECIDVRHIFVVGNPVIDALFYIHHNVPPAVTEISQYVKSNKRLILLTTHRRENFHHLTQIHDAILEITDHHKEVEVIFPVHPNPNVRNQISKSMREHDRIHIIDPLDYASFTYLLKHAYLVVTDSGGIQEEAPAFNVPVIIVRDSTERTEGVEAGTLILAGTDKQIIKGTIENLLTDTSFHQHTAEAVNPYGDGQTSERIVEWLKQYLSRHQS